MEKPKRQKYIIKRKLRTIVEEEYYIIYAVTQSEARMKFKKGDYSKTEIKQIVKEHPEDDMWITKD